MDFYITLITDLINTIVWLSFPFQLLTFKKKKKYVIVSITALLILEAMNIAVRLNETLYNTPLKTIIIMSLFLFIYIYCFEEKLSQKIIGCIGFYIILGLTEVSAFATFYLLGVEINSTNLIHNIATLTFIFVTWLLFLIFKNIFNKHIKNKQFSSEMWRFYIILASQFISSLIITYSIYINEKQLVDIVFTNPTMAILLSVYFIVSIFGDYFLYKILVINSENYDLKQELELSKIKDNLEIEYYKKLKDNIEATDKLNHDMKNMLTIIKSLATSDNEVSKEQALNMINNLSKEIEDNRIIRYCENDLINIVLVNKSKTMIENNIEFSTNINLPNTININDIDLCRIYSNIVDNAIDSCLNAKEKDNSFIVLNTNVVNNTLAIECTNYCDNKSKTDNKKLKSWKPNHKGLGIEILNSIAHEYNGVLYTDYNEDNETFNTKLTLSLNSSR